MNFDINALEWIRKPEGFSITVLIGHTTEDDHHYNAVQCIIKASLS